MGITLDFRARPGKRRLQRLVTGFVCVILGKGWVGAVNSDIQSLDRGVRCGKGPYRTPPDLPWVRVGPGRLTNALGLRVNFGFHWVNLVHLLELFFFHQGLPR